MIPEVAITASSRFAWKVPSRMRNSPTNPFSPGNPIDESVTNRNTAEKTGTMAHRPPKSAIMRECRRS